MTCQETFAPGRPPAILKRFCDTSRIFCVDLQQSVITKIRGEADARHITNLETVIGRDDDPRLSPGIFDAILVSNAYHEFTQPSAMLKHIRGALKPNGTLVVVENCSIAHR